MKTLLRLICVVVLAVAADAAVCVATATYASSKNPDVAEAQALYALLADDAQVAEVARLAYTQEGR